MQSYLDSLKFVLANGSIRKDRTGVGTISYFGMSQRYDLSKHFPALTTKKLSWLSVVSELLWFLEGSTDENRLKEILFSHKETNWKNKKTIWTENANAPYWQNRAKFKGDLGYIYGYQWRNWGKHLNGVGFDQVVNLIEGIKKDPYSRRHIISAWNVFDLENMALPPCHILSQFYVSNDNRLSCKLTQRSADLFLGVPFNIASYSLLTHIIAKICNLQVGEFIHEIGDAHIYLNHLEAVYSQLERKPKELPTLLIKTDNKNINDFKITDFILHNYDPYPSIKAPMAV